MIGLAEVLLLFQLISTGRTSVTGSASFAPSAATFPLKADATGRYLTTQSGAPFLLIGDSPQSPIGILTAAQINTYLDDRAVKGFNALWFNFPCADYTYCPASGNATDGTKPFTSGTSPSNFDLATPNNTYWTKVDNIVTYAASKGIVIFFDPLETGSFLTTMQNNGTTKTFNFGVYLGNRYKNNPNIVWMPGNDFQTWQTGSDLNLVKQLLDGIRSVDSNHLSTVELNYYRSYSTQTKSTLTTELGINLSYTYYSTYDYNLIAYNDTYSGNPLPVVMIEANYEFENNTFGFSGVTDAYILREQEYWCSLSGALGQFYGNLYTVRSTWPGSGNLDTIGVTELGYWKSFFSSRQWWLLVPDQNHTVVTSGYGTYAANSENFRTMTYATTARVANGSLIVSYTPVATTLRVDMTKMSGSTRARWYDPTAGTYSTVSGSPFANTGTHDFATPGNNSAGSPDWVLVLEYP